MAASQNFPTVVNNVAGCSQPLPLVVNQVPSAVGNMQNHHQAMAIQPNMIMNTQQQVVVQGQTQQQTQAQPTAFMLVPIPQMPSVQVTLHR